MTTVDEHAPRTGISRGLHVAFFITDDDAAGDVDAHRACRIDDQFRLRLAALARIIGPVRAIQRRIEWTEQLLDSPVHRLYVSDCDHAARNAALIRHHGDRNARRPKTVQRVADSVNRADEIGIPVVRDVDDKRPVAIENHAAHVHAASFDAAYATSA